MTDITKALGYSCRLKPNGNMRRWEGTRAGVTSMLEAVPSVTLPGTIRTRGVRPRKSGRRRLTSWACTICPETYGNGAATGWKLLQFCTDESIQQHWFLSGVSRWQLVLQSVFRMGSLPRQRLALCHEQRSGPPYCKGFALIMF